MTKPEPAVGDIQEVTSALGIDKVVIIDWLTKLTVQELEEYELNYNNIKQIKL